MTSEEKSEFFKIPFNTYDIFGYLIPGGALIAGAYIFDFISLTHDCHYKFLPVYNLINAALDATGTNFTTGVILLILLILASYVTGHINSSISSIAIDRLLVERGHGYPYENLLKIANPGRKNTYNTAVRGWFLWLNIYLVLQYLGFILPSALLTKIAGYIAYFIIIISMLIIVYGILSYINNRLNKKLIFISKLLRIIHFIIRFFFTGLFDLLSVGYSKSIRSHDNLDNEFLQSYAEHFKSNFNMDYQTAKTNNYWYPFLFATEGSKTIASAIRNWLFLYSFARNLASSLFLLFIYMFGSLLYQNNIPEFGKANLYLLLPIVVHLAFIVMLLRYYYLYKNYYTKFILRSFVYLNTQKQNNRSNSD